VTEAAHSRNSASKFEAEMLCPGRRAMTQGAPRSASEYAAWGTVAHGIADDCLRNTMNPEGFVGRVVEQDGFKVKVDDEMADCVRTYIDNARDIAGGAHVMPETRVYYDQVLDTARHESFGTADVIALRGDELQVHDLKAGRGVEVDARDNVQMKLYGLGALQLLDEMTGTDGIENVRLVIHQPRIKRAPSEWVISVADLRAWGPEARRAREQADAAVLMRQTLAPREWEAIYLNPNEKSCKFCEAKATCPALKRAVLDAVKRAPRATTALPEEF
jgi:Protein of unknown function (DUF2800)